MLCLVGHLHSGQLLGLSLTFRTLMLLSTVIPIVCRMSLSVHCSDSLMLRDRTVSGVMLCSSHGILLGGSALSVSHSCDINLDHLILCHFSTIKSLFFPSDFWAFVYICGFVNFSLTQCMLIHFSHNLFWCSVDPRSDQDSRFNLASCSFNMSPHFSSTYFLVWNDGPGLSCPVCAQLWSQPFLQSPGST